MTITMTVTKETVAERMTIKATDSEETDGDKDRSSERESDTDKDSAREKESDRDSD